MNSNDEKPPLTLEDYWRDLERKVYPDADPLACVEFRKLFFSGAFATMTILVETVKNAVDLKESGKKLDALKDELIAFSDTMTNDTQAPPPKGEGP